MRSRYYEWSKEWPIESGWYWFYGSFLTQLERLEMIELFEGCCRRQGIIYKKDDSWFNGHWMKVETPIPPQLGE